MLTGYSNEFIFVQYLNGKTVGELNPIFNDLFYRLYGNLNHSDRIVCWKNSFLQKADFFVKVNGIIKGISLKKGIKNSIHVDAISEFIHFLIENYIPKDVVIAYLKYHYADGTTNGSGKKRLSIDEYKKSHEKEIIEINKWFNRKEILENAIDRFILLGNNSRYKIDAIIHGEVDDFIWLTRDEIKDLILSKSLINSTGVHFGPLFCQPQCRCLNYNPNNESKRFCVQIKWYNLCDDIIEYRNNLLLKKNNIYDMC